MTAVNDSEPTYVFGPRERHALLLGMRLSQLLLVAEGAVLLLLGLLSESGAGVLLSAAAALGCLLVAFLPVQGRPLVEWVRPLLNYLYGRVTGQGLFLGGPWAMHGPTDGPHTLRLPGAAGSVRVRAVNARSGEVAVVRQGSRCTAVL